MATQLTLDDTFKQWLDKINAFVTEYNIFSVASQQSFSFTESTSTGLTVNFVGGKVRIGSVVDEVPDTALTLNASSTDVVAIFKVPGGAPAVLQVYTQASLPDTNVIPIALFTTDATARTSFQDLRAIYTFGGSGANTGGILQLDKSIAVDTTIPATRNALSIDPTVETGVTVTVETGSIWVIL